MNRRKAKKIRKTNFPYCHKSKSLFWCDREDNNSVREIYVELDGTISVMTNLIDLEDVDHKKLLRESGCAYLADYPSLKVGCNVEINYCPMCGRSLRHEY